MTESPAEPRAPTHARQMARRFILPLAAILVLSAALTAGLLWQAARSEVAAEQAGSQAVLAGALAGESERLAILAGDLARDPTSVPAGLEAVVVPGPDAPPVGLNGAPLAGAPVGLAALAQRARETGEVATGAVAVGDRPALAAAARRGPAVVALLQPLDRGWLAALGSRYQLDDLRLVAADAGAMMTLSAPGGTRVAGLAWQVTQAGERLVAGTLLPVLAIFALMLILAWLLLGRVRHAAAEADSCARDALATRDALQLSEGRLRDFAEAASDWFWETDTDQRFSHVSDRLEAATGIPVSALLGRRVADALGPGSDGSNWQALGADLAAGRAFRDRTCQLRLGNGDDRIIRLSGRPIRDEAGVFRGFRGTGTDITHELSAHSDALHLQSLLREAVESLSEGFVLFDSHQRLAICNQTYRDAYPLINDMLQPGIQHRDLLAAAARRGNFVAPDEDAVQRWVAARLDRHRTHSGAVEAQLANGRWYRISEKDTTGGGVVKIISDITDTKHREEALAILAAERPRGESFFDQVVRAIAVGLGWKWVGVGRLQADGHGVEVVSFWDEDQLGAPFTYDSRGTPCEEVYRTGQASFLPRDLARQYPEDPRLADRPAACYLGDVVRDSEGRVIGHVFALHDGASAADTQAQSFFTLALHRLGAELRRDMAEQARRESEARFRDFAEAASDWFWASDGEVRLTYVSDPRVTDLFHPLGLTPIDLMDDADTEPRRRQLENDLRSRRPFRDVVFRTGAGHGDGRYLKMSGKPVFDGDGAFVGYRGVASDITDQEVAKAREAALQQRFLDSVESLASGFALFGPDERLVLCNSRCGELFPPIADQFRPGVTLESLLRAGIDRQMFDTGEADGDAFLAAALNGYRNPPTDDEIALEDGRTFQVSQRRTQDGGAVVLWTDVSEHKNRENQLRHAQKMEAVGKMAGGIAHEFNNLLTAIGGFAVMALRKLDDPSRARMCLEEISNASTRASELTSQLLVFSRKQVMEPRLVQINESVEGMRRMLRPLLGEPIKVTMNLDPRPLSALVDPTQLSQAILNLAINARDAMPEGGYLTVTTDTTDLDAEAVAHLRDPVPAGPYIRVAVQDTGTGIDAETLRHIFEPFFTTKEPGKGTGLGLAMVYGMARQAGGTVMVDSVPGQGSTFTLLLPLAEGEGERRPGFEPGETGSGQGTILVIEDEEPVRQLASMTLEEMGFHVLLAEDGENAISVHRAHEGEIDLILSDVVMPGRSGPEVVSAILVERPEAQALFMSGYPDRDVQLRGIGDVKVALPKPFTPETLAKAVRQTLKLP